MSTEIGKLLRQRLSLVAVWSFFLGIYCLFISAVGLLSLSAKLSDYETVQTFSVFLILPLFVGIFNYRYVFLFQWGFAMVPVLLGFSAMRSLNQNSELTGIGLARIG